MAILLALQLKPLIAEAAETVKEPTCTEAGYTLTEDTETHTIVTETLPPLGHRFGEWKKVEGSGIETRTCEVCGETESRRPEDEAEAAVARLELTGSMQGVNKKTKVTLDASFNGQGEQFECYAVMSLQGHSTMGLDKPNYTIRFYNDPKASDKHKLTFGNWQKEHKYILKADYYDVTQCRNLVGAELWREIETTRDSLYPRIASLPTLGAVDGFPVSVWLNGEFLGLYTMCLHKDDDLFGMKDGERNALLICNEHTEPEAEFRAPAVLDEEGVHNWEMEYCGTEDWSWARDSFNALISFTMNSSDEDFREHLGDYLDIQAATDYLIFIYALGLENSGMKDLVMVNYGDIWIPCAFDMDEAFGLESTGFQAVRSPSGDFLPTEKDGVWSSETGSLLWDRFLQCFEPEIAARYLELRGSVLTETNMCSVVDAYTESIPEPLYLRDADQYPERPDHAKMIQQIQDYIPERLTALDLFFGGTEE